MTSPFQPIINIVRGGSIRRQLIIGIALVHAALMTIFVYDLVTRQKAFLEDQTVKQAQSLAATLATNSTSWVLADDVIGLEEIVLAQAQYPFLRYAFVTDLSGKVLGHTIVDNLGRYVTDPVSVSLLQDTRKKVILINDGTTVDAAAEIVSGGQRIGWARIALDRR